MDNSKAKRAPVTLKIKFKSETLAQFIERYAVDVSPGGIFIRTKDPLAVGTPMKFEFQLRDATPLITGEGTVVWTRENDPARPNAAPGMGVRFDRLGDGSQTVLDKILAEKNKTATGATNEAQPRLFGDAPTRVAPSPLVGQLIGESRAKLGEMAPPRTGFGDERTDTTPLPRPMPFHSDAEEFPDETFEEATKVRSVEDLVAATAHGGGLASLKSLPPRSTLQMATPPVPAPSTPPATPLARLTPPIPPPTAHPEPAPRAAGAPPPPPAGHHAPPRPPLPTHAKPPLQAPADSLFGGATVVAPPPIPVPVVPAVIEPATDVLSADAVGAEIDAPAADAKPAAATDAKAAADLDLPAVPEAAPAPRPTPPMPMAAVEPVAEAAATDAKPAEAAAEAKPADAAEAKPADAAEAKPADAAEAKPADAAAEAEAKPADAAADAKPADAAAEAKPADAAAEAKPADAAAEAKPADAAAEAKPTDAAAEAKPAEATAEPAPEPAAAPIAATTPAREPTPLPAAKPAPAPAEAKPPARMRPTGVPIPPPELTDPNRKHFVDTSAAAQIETPPLFTPGMIVLAIVFVAALGGLIWFFFLRPSEPDQPITDPSSDTAPTQGSSLATPSSTGELAALDEPATRWSI